MVRRALSRQTRWYQIRCSTFEIKDFIVEKTVLENFGILPPGDPNFDLSQKNDRNDFEMIFRELSNAAFRFSLRRPGAEIMGAGVQTPPPPLPAGGGKSRGPAGRGLTSVHRFKTERRAIAAAATVPASVPDRRRSARHSKPQPHTQTHTPETCPRQTPG